MLQMKRSLVEIGLVLIISWKVIRGFKQIYLRLLEMVKVRQSSSIRSTEMVREKCSEDELNQDCIIRI